MFISQSFFLLLHGLDFLFLSVAVFAVVARCVFVVVVVVVIVVVVAVVVVCVCLMFNRRQW